MASKPPPAAPVSVPLGAQRRPSSVRHRIEARVQLEFGRAWGGLARRGWERFGDVVVLQFLPRVPLATRRALAQIVAEELGAKTVVEDQGGVRGALRRPRVRVLFGSDTRTLHRENALLFAFDVSKTMFSSGNIEERARLARMKLEGETVVDLFAGIGYFTLPVAARSGASRVFACEKDPDSFAFLLENLRLNRVAQKVVPLLGDCRTTAPKGVADRVVMGYLGGTEKFLPTAIAALKPAGGTVHFHEAYPQETKFADARRALGRAACGEWKVRFLREREVKSFAPGIDHIVVDAQYRPLARRGTPSG